MGSVTVGVYLNIVSVGFPMSSSHRDQHHDQSIDRPMWYSNRCSRIGDVLKSWMSKYSCLPHLIALLTASRFQAVGVRSPSHARKGVFKISHANCKSHGRSFQPRLLSKPIASLESLWRTAFLPRASPQGIQPILQLPSLFFDWSFTQWETIDFFLYCYSMILMPSIQIVLNVLTFAFYPPTFLPPSTCHKISLQSTTDKQLKKSSTSLHFLSQSPSFVCQGLHFLRHQYAGLHPPTHHRPHVPSQRR